MLVIMPKAVKVPVMNILNPEAIPIVGPNINFNVLDILTRKYLKISSVINEINNKSMNKVLK